MQISTPTDYTVVQKALVWKFPKNVGPYTLYGDSWACDKTAFQIPELQWTLDSGFVPHPQVSYPSTSITLLCLN